VERNPSNLFVQDNRMRDINFLLKNDFNNFKFLNNHRSKVLLLLNHLNILAIKPGLPNKKWLKSLTKSFSLLLRKLLKINFNFFV
jgi:hypothetical protein